MRFKGACWRSMQIPSRTDSARSREPFMAFPSPPLTFACRACGWNKTLPFQVSDCRIPGFDHFAQCPCCGGGVVSRRAKPLEVLAARLRLGRRHR